MKTSNKPNFRRETLQPLDFLLTFVFLDMHALRHASTLGIVAILYTFIYVSVQSFSFQSERASDGTKIDDDFVKYSPMDNPLGIFTVRSYSPGKRRNTTDFLQKNIF